LIFELESVNTEANSPPCTAKQEIPPVVNPAINAKKTWFIILLLDIPHRGIYIILLKVNMQGAKGKILHRLKIAKGHLEKIINMVEGDEYCINVVHQSLAVQSALRKVDEVILENHLKTNVADSIKRGDTKKAIGEMMDVLKKK